MDREKKKAPAAICRKVSNQKNNGEIEVWGDGNQTRSFLYIDECIEATRRLMDSNFQGPVNIGSEEMISINNLAKMAISYSNKNLKIDNIEGERFRKNMDLVVLKELEEEIQTIKCLKKKLVG